MRLRFKFFLGVTVLLFPLFLHADTASAVQKLNTILHTEWQKKGLHAVPPADDMTYLRRMRLLLTGRAPTQPEITAFASDHSPNKRAALVRRLLASQEYAELMAMRYADMFRIKSEFPINLWPNAVQLYHRYWQENALADRPLSVVARELLTASGSNFRVAPANYFRAAADRTPAGWARLVMQDFLALKSVPPEVIAQLSPFFSRIAMKSTAEWKEQIVYLDPAAATVTAVTPDGRKFTVSSPQQDPRNVFADWLAADPAGQFSRAWVNRAWYWLFGSPLSGSAADALPPPAAWKSFPRAEAAPALNEAVMTLLADEFHRTGGSMRQLLEVICLCDFCNADWKTVPAERQQAAANFAIFPVHRIESEIVVDLLGDLTGVRERYRSVIPEPFTILPPTTRAIAIDDGSISSSTLDTFGRPPRDSGMAAERNNAVTGSQRLFLMNSSRLYSGLQGLVTRRLVRQYKTLPRLIDGCYLAVLSRHVTDAELKTVLEYASTLPKKGRNQAVAMDLLWSLVNSKEFLYHH